MVYEGYARFGGTEIVNNERVRGYSDTSDCPPNWFIGPGCDTLRDALQDGPYTADNIANAPWFDGALADLSSRFHGVFGLKFANVENSTRSAPITEGIEDGGSIGRTRKGVREVRVSATLVGHGRDALEYGISWLNAAIDPGSCGQHGTACGTTDFEYLVDCPPERETLTVDGQWAENGRNTLLQPLYKQVGDWYTLPSTATATRVAGRPGGGQYALRATSVGGAIGGTLATVTPGSQLSYLTPTPDMLGQPMVYSVYIKSPQPIEIAGSISLGGGQAVTLEPRPVLANQWVRISQSFTIPTDSTNFSATMVARTVGGVAAPAGVVIDFADPQLEFGTRPGDWFSGDSLDSERQVFSWAGPVNNSASIREILPIIVRPQNDEEYAVVVDTFRRYLHDVSVTSGPIEVSIFHSKTGDYWGTTMEWTVASERPWIYSLTRPVELPTTSTIVIQDTPYNLAEYPSAELAAATPDVVTATNHATNPSVETNATGWSPSTVTVTGDNPFTYMSGARVTGELAAVGSASYRVRLLGNGATVAGGTALLRAAQTADIPVDAGTRISVSMWGAVVISAGQAGSAIKAMGAYGRWANASNNNLGQVDLGSTTEYGGHAWDAASLIPVAGATKLTVFVQVEVDWASSATPANNSDIRLYADALAITTP